MMLDLLTEADAGAAAALSKTFNWPHRPDDWALFLSLGQGMAWREGGRLLGTAVFFPLDAMHGAVGLVQVSPALQGRGIGRRLMEAVMAIGAGRSLRLHATAAGAGLYARLGFRAAGVVQQWQGVVGAGGPTSRTAEDADLSEICAFDRQATGLDRHTLLRRLFDASTTHLSGPRGAITGYAMRRTFGRGALLGPVVATDEVVATALLAGLQQPGFLRFDAPDASIPFQRVLSAAGLDSVEDVQVMVHGKWPAAPSVFALGSQAFG